MTILNYNELLAHFTAIGIHAYGEECISVIDDRQADELADIVVAEFKKFYPTCDNTSKESQLKSIRNYFNKLIKTFEFKITILDSIKDTSELIDLVFDSGCNDSLLAWNNELPYIEFKRQARSIELAIHLALEQLKSVGLKHFSVSWEIKYED